MIRLHVLAEGQTEETFVNRVLKPHLASKSVFIDVRCICTRKLRSRRAAGGIVRYESFKRDLGRWIKEDSGSDSWFTTMIDLFALPEDFPGNSLGNRPSDPFTRVAEIENGMKINEEYQRFAPYIQLHEFEALLFSDLQQLDWEFIEHEAAIAALVNESRHFSTPELIDDDPESAPSKRIINHIPEYKARKASAGPYVAEKIGLDTMRNCCKHFDEWLSRIESFAPGRDG